MGDYLDDITQDSQVSKPKPKMGTKRRYLGYRIKNIQSWADETIMLSEGLTVIQGRSQTGKSVYPKIMRIMCFPDFYGIEWRGESMIRHDCEFGECWTYLSDYTVKFEVYKTRQIYRLLDLNNREIQSWQQESLPAKLKEILGWYVDEEYKIILNLIDSEMGLPFDSSPKAFDTRIVDFIVSNPSLKESEKYLNEYLQQLTKAKKSENVNIKTLTQMKSLYNYTDVITFKSNMNLKHRIADSLEFLLDLNEGLYSMSKVEVTEFTEVDSPMVEYLLDTIRSIDSRQECLTEAMSLVSPIESTVDLELLEHIDILSDKLAVLTLGLTSLSNIDLTVVRGVDESDVINLLRLQDSIEDISNELYKFKDIQLDDFEDIDSTSVNTILDSIEILDTHLIDLSDYKTHIEGEPKFIEVDTEYVEHILEVYDDILDFNTAVKSVSELECPNFTEADTDYLDKLLEYQEVVDSLLSMFNLYQVNLSKSNTCSIQLSKLETEISEFEVRHKFCPSCGQQFQGVHRHNKDDLEEKVV